jgi:hypothetical protein
VAKNGRVTAVEAAEGEAFNETWVSYPNDDPPVSYPPNPGERRAALAPWMAHKAGGGYVS